MMTSSSKDLKSEYSYTKHLTPGHLERFNQQIKHFEIGTKEPLIKDIMLGHLSSEKIN